MVQQKVGKVSFTRRFLDRMRNPPEYVDEELPTKTVRIFSRNKLGTKIDACTVGGSIMMVGSKYFSGSHYDFGPGSFSLRITRRSVYIGSRSSHSKVGVEWRLRHSREGTIDMIPFRTGSLMQAELLGGPMNPIYAFGPGTIWTYFKPDKGTSRVYSSLEGVF